MGIKALSEENKYSSLSLSKNLNNNPSKIQYTKSEIRKIIENVSLSSIIKYRFEENISSEILNKSKNAIIKR